MDDTTSTRPLIAGWWSRLPDGGMKRIWVTRDGEVYRCRLEVCSQAQDAARSRLFDALNGARSERRPAPAAASADAVKWSGATFATLDTANAAEAWRFLGEDDVASCALLAADALVQGQGAAQGLRFADH